MRRISSTDLKNINLLKHYRIIRKWACKSSDLKEADLELLIYLESLNHFTKHDFKQGTYSYSWDNRRWNRLLSNGWIKVWREVIKLENQHRKITGYRELSQEEIDVMNEIKAAGKELGELVDKLRAIESLDQRWISIGATDLQKGLMGLTRGVAKPEFF